MPVFHSQRKVDPDSDSYPTAIRYANSHAHRDSYNDSTTANQHTATSTDQDTNRNLETQQDSQEIAHADSYLHGPAFPHTDYGIHPASNQHA
jgi:hypothetical protein